MAEYRPQTAQPPKLIHSHYNLVHILTSYSLQKHINHLKLQLTQKYI
jgi:hypothetical protein